MQPWLRKVLGPEEVQRRERVHAEEVARKRKVREAARAERDRKRALNQQAHEKLREERALAGIPIVPDGRGKKRLITPDGKMACKECQKLLPLTEFFVHLSKRTGRKHYDSRCHPCRKSRMIGNRVGLTIRQHQRMIADVSGRCEICATTPRKAYIDHCHLTGVVRGVLCPSCNSGLAYFHDNPAVMRNAAQYLEKYQIQAHPVLLSKGSRHRFGFTPGVKL